MADSAIDPNASSPFHPEDPEVEVDADIDMNIDTSAAEKPPQADAEMEEEPIVEPREPTKKDVSLRDFLSKMDDYAPIVSPMLFAMDPVYHFASMQPSLTETIRYPMQ